MRTVGLAGWVAALAVTAAGAGALVARSGPSLPGADLSAPLATLGSQDGRAAGPPPSRTTEAPSREPAAGAGGTGQRVVHAAESLAGSAIEVAGETTEAAGPVPERGAAPPAGGRPGDAVGRDTPSAARPSQGRSPEGLPGPAPGGSSRAGSSPAGSERAADLAPGSASSAPTGGVATIASLGTIGAPGPPGGPTPPAGPGAGGDPVTPPARDDDPPVPEKPEPPSPRPDEGDDGSTGDDDAVPRGPTVVRLAVEAGALVPGAIVDVHVRLENGVGVASVPFHLRFDPTVLQFELAMQGPFLGGDGAGAIVMAAPLSSGDVVVVGASRLGAVPGIDGSGELCVLRFRVAGAGVTTFAFDDASVRGPSGEPLAATFAPATVLVP